MTGNILLTGATGFTGQHFVEYLLNTTDLNIYCLRRLTCRWLTGAFQSPRIRPIFHDFTAEIPDRILRDYPPMNYMVHLGAEVHGIRSLQQPELFIHANAMGTFNMLEAARSFVPEHFIYVSSAEAVGATDGEPLAEDCALKPSNPYSAAKAAGEMMCLAYRKSFGVPVSIVRTMNLFGPRQDISKFVPATIKKILNGETVTIHVDKHGKSGSRCWLFVHSFVDALTQILQDSPDTYHIVGPECSNWEIVALIEKGLRLPAAIECTLPGRSHDMRYAIKDTKYVGRYCTSKTDDYLIQTAKWYLEHPEWIR